MQMDNIETLIIDEEPLFFSTKKKSSRARKWREIEDVEARQRLTRELQDIDQSFVFSMTDLV